MSTDIQPNASKSTWFIAEAVAYTNLSIFVLEDQSPNLNNISGVPT